LTVARIKWFRKETVGYSKTKLHSLTMWL